MKIGDVVGDRWRIRREIGSGGMGVVYAAEDVGGGGPDVAVKILRDDVRGLDGTVERFLREVRLAARLRSKHAVRIVGSGRMGDAPFMVMELLEGICLSRMSKLRQRIAEDEAVQWITDACDAVGEAHDVGIVHRDLKLGNLFLSISGDAPVVKVLDFGLAKNLLSDEPSLTSPDDGFGTPQFMPPEQYVDVREVDARSDVWSLAVCLYRLVTGVYPVKGKTLAQLCIELNRPDFVATPASKHLPSISPHLERVLACALSKAKYDRYPDAVHFGAALRATGTEIGRRPPRRDVTPSSCTRVAAALATTEATEPMLSLPLLNRA